MTAQADTPARQLVLLCDGTNNNLTGGVKDTNVVKLAELLAASPDAQRLLNYDPGVGNSGELPGATVWDQFRRRLNRLNGLAFGRGVYENMAECYLFLMRHYRPGDEIYIFGFSRGAFTARSVAGLVNQFGILRPQMEGLLPTLLHVYFSDRTDNDKVNAVAQQISRNFADEASRKVNVHFIGVWDTVASVGLWPFNARFTALPTPQNKRFIHIRQALALDEHRTQFKPRLYARDNGAFPTLSGREGSLVQLWFPGSHCDVGGGYEAARSTLSDLAFAWLVSESVQCGLRIEHDGVPLTDAAAVEARLHAVLQPPPPPGRPQEVHSELCNTALWALTGMCVRETNEVVMDGDQKVCMSVRAEAHAAAQAQRMTFKEHSAWARAKFPWLMWVMLLAAPFILLALGQLLFVARDHGSLWANLQAAWHDAPDYLCANLRFQSWQLTGWLGTDWPRLHEVFASPRWALVWDFAFIACYAVVLSCLAAHAFSRLAGLRRAGDPARPVLNALGLALPVAVCADIGENIFTWFAVTLGVNDVGILAMVSHAFAALLSVGKFVGLLGVLVLLGWGLARPRTA